MKLLLDENLPKRLKQDLETLKTRVGPICVEAGIDMLSVFGSVARGDHSIDSDVDLLVRFKKPVGMFELIDFEQRLSHVIGQKIDLGTEACLHPLIKDSVRKDLRIIYEA